MNFETIIKSKKHKKIEKKLRKFVENKYLVYIGESKESRRHPSATISFYI
jgi:hypothetical protein